MKKIVLRTGRQRIVLMMSLLSMTLGTASFSLAGPSEAGPLVVKGEKVFTMAGDPVQDGVIVIQDGKIVSVNRTRDVTIPAGAHVLSAAVVTPGLIDAHTVVGLSGYLNQRQDQDQLERSAPMQPELRALDAYNPGDRLVAWVRSFGVTTIHTGHSPGRLISGQTMITKTWGNTADEAVMVPTAMVAASLGEAAIPRQKKGTPSPGTRAKAVAMLRGELIKAQAYQRKRQAADLSRRPERDLRLEALGQVLDQHWPLLITVQRQQDILAALRVGREFHIRLVLDGVAEADLVLEQIKAAHVSVIVHPTMTRAFGEKENLSMETAGKLAAAGIPLALQSGYEAYVPKTRVVLFEAAEAMAYGLPYQEALASITSGAAHLLGIDDRVGSLQPGMDADLALYDGDPLETTSHCIGVIIDGRLVSREVR